jgi:glycerol-1-phosphate dehydrogenase [NAD(P)+]
VQLKEVHRIDLPRIVLVGRGVIEYLGDVFRELELQRPIIVTGKKTYNIAGNRALNILKTTGFKADVSYCSEADLKTVESVRKDAEAFNADTVIGVGGGRTIDVAKLCAAKNNIKFISLPTTAAHDGIASSLASVKGLGRPYSMRANSPIAVIADSQIVAEAPYRFTASGCGDVISKAVSVKDWMLAHEDKGEYYGEYAASLALMGSNLVMRNAQLIKQKTDEGYRTLLEALVSMGVAMSIAGSSRPGSGSEHLFSHALDVLAPGAALHGEQCGVGSIMMANLHGINWKGIKNKLKVINAPTTAQELGIDDNDIIQALLEAKTIRPNRYTILNKVKLNKDSAETLAKKCGVI